MSELDKAEHETIARLVADIERKQGDPRVATGTKELLGEYLDHMKKRMEVLEQDGAVLDTRDKKENAAKMEAVIAAMVDRETRLNASEKQTYAGLLEKEYFTRNDLDDLERFYADGGAWEKLSEKGKEQIGLRLEEGIRRGEIDVEDLSPTIQKKRNDWLIDQLGKGKDPSGKFTSLSGEERAELIRQHKSGNDGAARDILSGKESFDYQLVDNQAATKRSNVAASPDGETSQTAPKKSYDFSGIDSGMLAGLSDAQEAVKPDLPKTNGGNSPSLPS